jgi:hypothetical protein
MAVVSCNFAAAQASIELVPAQAGRQIRVLRVVGTTWAALKFTLLAAPGAGEAALHAPLHVSTRGLELLLGRKYALATERGQALGFTAVFQGTPADSSLLVWYELVP